jgi:hypothetical protein
MKNFKYLLLPALVLVIGLGNAFGQMSRADSIKKMADSKMLVFLAQHATVSSGAGSESGIGKDITHGGTNHVTLPEGFKVVIKADSVISFLPYFNINADTPNEAIDNYRHVTVDVVGTLYSTTTYKYDVKQKKKGDVEIKITPTGDSPIDQFLIAITPSGTAELTLGIHDHASIVYEGIVVY